MADDSGTAPDFARPDTREGVASAPEWPSRLSDRERLALLLQGASLLAELDGAGRRLADGWGGTTLDATGRLVTPAIASGRDRVLPQERLRDLVALLFGSPDGVAGRGTARKIVRSLLEAWRQTLAPVPARRAVHQILDAAPFLADGVGEAVAPRAARGGEAFARATALYTCGRSSAALSVLEPLDAAPEVEVLRLRCRLVCGELGAVARRLKQLLDQPLPPEAVVDCAAVAVRVAANRNRPDLARDWLSRAHRAIGGDPEGGAGSEGRTERADGPTTGCQVLAARLSILEAESAWDRGEPEAMDRLLDEVASRIALDDHPSIAWRWHQARGLRALAADDGPAMVQAVSRALAAHRRGLCRHEAGGLWSDLGVGRARAGDLPGAERAFLHAQRLLGRCDGTRQTTLALYNLAEVRLRRGRVLGVEQILRRSTEENRLAGNARGLIQDLALWARFELVQGRPGAALDHVAAAQEIAGRRRVGWHRMELRLLEVRALGLLRRSDEAARRASGLPSRVLGELEPEERPGLFALAENRKRALEQARGTFFEPLWRALLDGADAPATPLWEPLETLEPGRAARVVLDAETLCPGSAPPAVRRRGVAAFRRVGATRYADALERVDGGPWQALSAYLEEGCRRRGVDPAALRRMLEQAGYPEVRIERVGEVEPDPEVLVGGAGGPEEIAVPLDGGRLTLRAARVDPALRAILALVVRELDPGAAASRPTDDPLRERAARVSSRRAIVGESPELVAAVDRIERLAPGDLPILILGETGTGKELAARHLHRSSPRRGGRFVAVNCAALSENLLLSDLFGHARGAFTGADRDRSGVFETAAGGTVFLDEIGDLPAAAQGMLLRVLQEGEVRRLGESLPRPVDVRIVTATHRDLAAMVRKSTFRQDLYYRLSVGVVELPALRDRGRDVVLLAERLLETTARAAPELDGQRLTGAARSRLLAHRWPGNVRELENIVRLAATLAGDGPIDAEHLELPARPGDEHRASGSAQGDYHTRIEAFRRGLIEEALEATGGNKAAAARRLGLSRQGLSYLAREMRIV